MGRYCSKKIANKQYHVGAVSKQCHLFFSAEERKKNNAKQCMTMSFVAEKNKAKVNTAATT